MLTDDCFNTRKVIVGDMDGPLDGCQVGACDGATLGTWDGCQVGWFEGDAEGCKLSVGSSVGLLLGCDEG